MILAAQLADALGLTELNQDALKRDASGALTIDPDCILALKLEKDFKACGMPTECPYSMSEMGAAMKKDKKAEGSIVHFVVPTAVGHVQIEDLTVEEVVRILG
jgi:3-dehydroquinate synthetase